MADTVHNYARLPHEPSATDRPACPACAPSSAAAPVEPEDGGEALRREVERLHRPRQNTTGLPDACPDCTGGIYTDDPDEVRECGCWGLSTPVCGVCSDASAVTSRRYPTQWPCETHRLSAAAAAVRERREDDGEVTRLVIANILDVYDEAKWIGQSNLERAELIANALEALAAPVGGRSQDEQEMRPADSEGLRELDERAQNPRE